MSIDGISAPGAKLVRLDLHPRVAVDVYLHLCGSMYSELTTMSSRTHVAGLLPQMRRALAATGVIDIGTLDALAKELSHKPAPPPLDVTARTEPQGS